MAKNDKGNRTKRQRQVDEEFYEQKPPRSVFKYLFFIVPLGLVIWLIGLNGTATENIAELEGKIKLLTSEVSDEKKKAKALELEFNEEEYRSSVVAGKHNADKIAEEVIEVQNILAAFYRASDPLPYDDDELKEEILENLKEAEDRHAELTDSYDNNHKVTWKLNPEWTIKLESKLMYGDVKRFPILFSMETKEGETAGIVEAEYHVESHKLSNIVRHYTNEGLRDEAEVGGR